MSTLRTVLVGTLVLLALGAVTAANAAVSYDAILEWTGPYYRVISNAAVNQMVDNPVSDIPFVQPYAVAAREHAADGRDVVYVVDSGHNRVQAFEANATYLNDATFTWQAGGAVAADDFDATHIFLHEWANPATRWVLPHSEVVGVDGIIWTYVADLTGFVAADHVYTIDYAAASGPIITFPAASLSSASTIILRYAITDYQGGGTAVFGLGDVDYGTSSGATVSLTKIDETSGGPTSFQLIRNIALIPNEGTATSDDIFLLDAADNSANQNEELFYYTVDVTGTVTYREAYDDVLTAPYGVAVADGGPTEVAAAVTVADDLGPFDQATAVVSDASQVTGHTYNVTVAGANVTITDATTGRVIINAAAFANLANPFLGIPGLSLPLNAAIGVTNTIATTKAVTDRYLFVTDTGADRIKIISASDDTPTATNDWLPGDSHPTMITQPVAAIGGTAGQDYEFSTPVTVPQDYSVWTEAFPIKEGTLSTITVDPSGANETWSRVNDIATAGPTDHVYQADWTSGKITFGDGVHGEIPPASKVLRFSYTTTPDIMHYGSAGTGAGRFSAPRGIAARWNAALAGYDVYVADTGNNRIQKLTFYPANTALNLPARMAYVCQWSTATNSTDVLSTPVDIKVALDGSTPAVCYLAVSDQGNDRIVIYKDTAATVGGGATVPAYDNTLGAQGNALGVYAGIEGLTWLPHGTSLDIYAADAVRGTVTKYEASPAPSITLNMGGAFSPNPQCFRPTSSYTFSFTLSNAPSGGWIDFYYDTASTFNSSTAMLCIPAGTILPTVTSATWSFEDTPGGVPADNLDGYYVYAVLRDINGTAVATAAAGANYLFCIDSSLLPNLKGTDAVDGDATLYLQNGTERTVDLQVSYPDSTIAVGFNGTFDNTLCTVTGITPGNGWDGTGGMPQFNSSHSNTNGTYLVSTSVIDAPIGLVGNGPYTLAHLNVKALDNAIDLTNRFKSATLTILTTGSSINDIHGNTPAAWTTHNVNLRFAYLGDLATTGSGADSVLPNLRVKPDGKINFDDQMVFTLGWNGKNSVQDRIADIGPTEGTLPDLRAVPDGLYNVDDILAFTVMYSWAAGLGFQRTDPGSLALNPVTEPRPALLGEPVTGEAQAFTVAHLDQPRTGELVTVDLNVDHVSNLAGAQMNLSFDPTCLELVAVENGGFLDGRSGSMFFHRSGNGWVEVSTSRLDQQNPGVSGGGTIARATFRILNQDAGDLSLRYDLRSSEGRVLSRGEHGAEPYTGSVASFQLYPANPNPVTEKTSIVYSVPAASHVALNVYDISGRRVRTLLNGQQDTGFHVVTFDGRNDMGNPLPAGVYFYRLQAAGKDSTKKLILTR
jgi:hypothetical protein